MADKDSPASALTGTGKGTADGPPLLTSEESNKITVDAIRDGEGTPSSIESTPEPETEALAQDPAQPQKRKGGRKPKYVMAVLIESKIYATSEERKQRNRQAQAAFRERRTEYIKQLEATIKQHEEALQTLQQSHRSAADECLMLRYKNSLLERILLEKGIDVQAELHTKTTSPALGGVMPHQLPAAPVAPPPLQRAAIQRHHARRSGPRMSASGAVVDFSAQSPQGQPTPSSHASSPSTAPFKSPVSLPHGGTTPPASAVMSHASHYRPYQQPPRTQYSMQQSPHRPSPPQKDQTPHIDMASNGARNGLQGGYYPSPYQNPIDSLGKLTPIPLLIELYPEYDAPSTEADSTDSRMFASGLEADQYSPAGHFQQHQPPPLPNDKMPPQKSGQTFEPDQSMTNAFDAYDPMLDADPFGLSASMHFPTNYSFDHQSHRTQ